MGSSRVATGAVSVAKPSDEEASELVGQLAEELERFAFERERVLAKLDIRAANLARRIGRELRVVLRGLALATTDEGRDGVMATLGGLLVEAHRLLEDVPADQEDADHAPQESGERPIVGAGLASNGVMQRKTVDAMPAVASAGTDGGTSAVPRLGADDDEEEAHFQDLTIARRVVWERSGNRILGR